MPATHLIRRAHCRAVAAAATALLHAQRSFTHSAPSRRQFTNDVLARHETQPRADTVYQRHDGEGFRLLYESCLLVNVSTNRSVFS